MKYLLLLFFAFSLSTCSSLRNTEVMPDEEITTLILLRHAEKASDGTSNPDLNERGKERAASLVEILKNVPIDLIYSTPYQRTENTVQPIAESKGITVTTYDARNLDFAKAIAAEHNGKTILIVGHSNTIPFMVNAVIGEEQFEQLEENEYDKLFFVSMVDEQTKVAVLSF